MTFKQALYINMDPFVKQTLSPILPQIVDTRIIH